MNILRGYGEAVKRAKRYIFMIEEDMLIANDFFKWHYEVQEAQDLFCSIASKNNNLNQNLILSPELNRYYTSHITYQSLGVCFKKEVVDSAGKKQQHYSKHYETKKTSGELFYKCIYLRHCDVYSPSDRQ